MKQLTVKAMHKRLRTGKAKLRSLRSIELKALTRKGYNKNYIRDWFNFGA